MPGLALLAYLFCGGRKSRRRCLAEHPLVVPVEVALVAVADEAGAGESVKLAGIDDELCRHVEAAEGLVHLFAADEGNVEVLVAAHEEGGGVNAVGMVER